MGQDKSESPQTRGMNEANYLNSSKTIVSKIPSKRQMIATTFLENERNSHEDRDGMSLYQVSLYIVPSATQCLDDDKRLTTENGEGLTQNFVNEDH